jgi:fumarate hydratase class I
MSQIEVDVPMTEADARRLKLGDEVSLSGTLVTARDAAHKYMTAKHRRWLAPVLQGSVIYHCGPVVKKERGQWRFTAAGPTTSIREEPYQGQVIADYQVRGVIGKGGMGPATLAALKEHGAVYLHAIGGAASLLAGCVKRVADVHLLEELGVPEAFWVIEVERFPVVVTMDSRGKSLHRQVERASRKKLAELYG